MTGVTNIDFQYINMLFSFPAFNPLHASTYETQNG